MVAAGALFLGVVMAPAAGASPGSVLLNLTAAPIFDTLTAGATPAQQQFIRDRFRWIRGYEPFFDRALPWAPPSFVYSDLYAIYRDFPEFQELRVLHPDWVLEDGQGRDLFIPFDCSGASCTQYAGDIGNPAWRAYWIGRQKEILARGYDGVFIDDVNMEMMVSDGQGNFVRPFDPRTGTLMSNDDWRRYMAEFSEEIRAQLPGYQIIHSGHWWYTHRDPYLLREIAAADVIELERGFNDAGLTPGRGKFGFVTFMEHVDWLHARGKQVLFEPHDLNATSAQFELAGYLLTQAGGDTLSPDYRVHPNDFWNGWETDLGKPRGKRRPWQRVYRRVYSRGLVLLNQPGARARKLSLGRRYYDLDGRAVRSVTLAPRSGQVLFRERGFVPG